jgi:hypothetical protein
MKQWYGLTLREDQEGIGKKKKKSREAVFANGVMSVLDPPSAIRFRGVLLRTW